jgi:predicted ATPase
MAGPLSLEEARTLLDDGTARGLFVRRGDMLWAFSHVLVREAFYRELAPEQQRALHALIAQALERRVDQGAEDLLSPLAHHAAAGAAERRCPGSVAHRTAYGRTRGSHSQPLR